MPSRIASDDHLCGTADNAGRVPGAHGGTGDILLDPETTVNRQSGNDA